VSDDVKKSHIENIEQNLKILSLDSSAEKNVPPGRAEDAVPENVCPNCGGELVLRTAKKGTNAGSRFYGCSNYPRCRYVRNL
jgi:ssDNA-binding Zn-finger/Zn-ribbon topoisomerase 1